ncbi:MAG: GAF domain-containing protein [Betaproteobacteria bacterium]|nr:GAF domain-containing protein [Betaproteobacteria bacterium]
MEKELRILMIEDVPHDAELEMRELKRAGLRVTHRLVETEEAFRAALREFRPELIISDFSMPHFDGMFALAIARELAPDVPFIFVSGTIGEEYAIRALKNGATDYVLKNNLVRLPAAVERALQEAKERAARRRAEQEIAHQRAFLRQVIDLDRNRIFAKDREGRFTLVNQAFADAYGRSVEDLLGKTTADFNPDPEQAERFRKDDLEVLNNLREVFVPEERITDANGEVRWVQAVKRPLVSADGKANMVLGVATDITERKLQELKIARLNRVLSVLSGINSAIVRIRNRQELFEEACRIAVEHGGFGIAWIGMLDPETLDVIPAACAGIEADSLLARSLNSARPDLPRGQGVVGRAIREKRAAFSNDLLAEPVAGGERRKEAIRRGYRSVIALPLLVENTTVGSLSLFAKEAGFFTDEESKLLTELAGDISFALDHLAKAEKLEKLSRIRAVSGEINAAIVRIHEREALLRETCRIAAEHGKFEFVWVALLDQEKQQVLPVAWTGFSPEAAHAVSWASISAARGTLGEAIRTRKAVVRNDLESDPVLGKLRPEALEKGCRSTVCLPLVVDDIVVALIVLFATGLGFFDESELALLNELAADVSFALQSISRREKLEYLSYYDALTGLPNRQLFVDRLGQQMRSRSGEPRMVALILLDIERLRNINEMLGRHGGDEMLRLVARRLERAFHGPDYIARIGADGFGVVIRGIRDAVEIAHAVESQVLACFGEPFLVNGKELRVAAKTGIAMFPADGQDADTLFKNAEAALRKAKESGERFLFYTAEMNAQAAHSLSFETRLRTAVEARQFVLHYQPKVELAGGRVCGLEALIRPHPRGRPVGDRAGAGGLPRVDRARPHGAAHRGQCLRAATPAQGLRGHRGQCRAAGRRPAPGARARDHREPADEGR